MGTGPHLNPRDRPVVPVEALDGPPRTTDADLARWAQTHLRGKALVVVSNREPYSHVTVRNRPRVLRNSGGLVVALDSVAQALGGVWVAGASRSGRNGPPEREQLPPGETSYLLRRVWQNRDDHIHFYAGFANAALWPLCHIAYVRPRFRRDDWERYKAVNTRFAEAVLEEIDDRPAVVFLQDYHLALAARTLRERRPDLQIVQFWHIPWPNPEVFRILPWRDEVLDGLLANDVLGFHIRRHAVNFLDSVAELLEARVDRERLAVDRGGRRTWVRHFPIGVDASGISEMAESSEAVAQEASLRRRFGLEGCVVGLGVDRLDYTKGIPERLEALERFFEKYPEWIGRFAFIQIGVPSRVELADYRQVMQRARSLVRHIQRRFPRRGGPTVKLIEANLDFRELVPYYRMADLCAVTSLHDGMNLVAKEYLAACGDLEGALVLSPFTGAARELERAWIATPYDADALADAYHAALTEPVEARQRRMAALREAVLRRNVFDWAIEVLNTMQGLTLRVPEVEPARS